MVQLKDFPSAIVDEIVSEWIKYQDVIYLLDSSSKLTKIAEIVSNAWNKMVPMYVSLDERNWLLSRLQIERKAVLCWKGPEISGKLIDSVSQLSWRLHKFSVDNVGVITGSNLDSIQVSTHDPIDFAVLLDVCNRKLGSCSLKFQQRQGFELDYDYNTSRLTMLRMSQDQSMAIIRSFSELKGIRANVLDMLEIHHRFHASLCELDVSELIAKADGITWFPHLTSLKCKQIYVGSEDVAALRPMSCLQSGDYWMYQEGKVDIGQFYDVSDASLRVLLTQSEKFPVMQFSSMHRSDILLTQQQLASYQINTLQKFIFYCDTTAWEAHDSVMEAVQTVLRNATALVDCTVFHVSCEEFLGLLAVLGEDRERAGRMRKLSFMCHSLDTLTSEVWGLLAAFAGLQEFVMMEGYSMPLSKTDLLASALSQLSTLQKVSLFPLLPETEHGAVRVNLYHSNLAGQLELLMKLPSHWWDEVLFWIAHTNPRERELFHRLLQHKRDPFDLVLQTDCGITSMGMPLTLRELRLESESVAAWVTPVVLRDILVHWRAVTVIRTPQWAIATKEGGSLSVICDHHRIEHEARETRAAAATYRFTSYCEQAATSADPASMIDLVSGAFLVQFAEFAQILHAHLRLGRIEVTIRRSSEMLGLKLLKDGLFPQLKNLAAVAIFCHAIDTNLLAMLHMSMPSAVRSLQLAFSTLADTATEHSILELLKRLINLRKEHLFHVKLSCGLRRLSSLYMESHDKFSTNPIHTLSQGSTVAQVLLQLQLPSANFKFLLVFSCESCGPSALPQQRIVAALFVRTPRHTHLRPERGQRGEH